MAQTGDPQRSRPRLQPRAAASRRNGACSNGPRSVAGKARWARNALKHGLSARRTPLLDDEDTAQFHAVGHALRAELAPVGALQEGLVGRIAVAAWRAERADRLEAALLASGDEAEAALGDGLIRDGHGPWVRWRLWCGTEDPCWRSCTARWPP